MEALSLFCTYINIQNGTREEGIVYPGEQTAMVVLTPGDIECLVTGTRCTASISDDDNYTLSLTLSNEIGSSVPVIHSFNCKSI